MNVRPLLALLACLGSLRVVPGQDALTIVPDVGLTLTGATPGVVHGTTCHVISQCGPLPAGGIARGTSRIATVFGAPNQVFALAIAPVPSICIGYPFLPGFLTANALTLQQPFVIALGVTGPLVPGLSCPGWGGTVGVGAGTWTLNVPSQVPAGLQFLMQGLVASSTASMAAFTPTLQATLL